jgi:hypothetical protein
MPTTAFAVTVTPPVRSGFFVPTELRIEDAANGAGLVQQNPGYLTLNGDTPFQERTRITDVTTLYFVSAAAVRIRAWIEGDDVSTTQVTPGSVASPAQLVLQPQASGPVAPAFATEMAASAAFSGRFATRDQASQIDGMSTVTLISGAEDEAPITSNCTTTNEARPGAIGGRAHRMSMTGAVTGQLIFDPPGGSSDPLIYGANTHAIGLVVDVEDVSRITTITIGLFSDSGLTQQWTLAASDATAALVNGRNVLRWRPWAGTTTGWGTAWRIRVVAVTNAATNIWVESAWAEQRAKSSIVLINDSCYETFYTQGYPACQARKYPVTWAPDPAILGSFPGDPGERMTEAELAAAMASGNGDECSFHGWDGAVTATMTAAQYRTDTMRAIRWLNERGYRDGAFWRAAVTQNVANNGAGADGYIWASGTYTGQTGNHEIFPPMETRRFNLSRIAIHGLNNAQIDALFATQQQFRTLTLWYLHGIHPTASGDTTPAMWAYWLSKVDEGVAAGWLEVTTMSNLFRRMGGRFISAQGRKAIQWTDQTGTLRTQLLP